MLNENLKTLASPILRSIKCRMPETFGVSVIDEKRAVGVVLDSVGGPDRFCYNIAVGLNFPLHTSAPGKAFIAALPEKRRNALLNKLTFKRFTPNTITTREMFEAEIAHIRSAGYATDFSEEIKGCHCGAVAVLNPKKTPVATLWVTGTAKRLPLKRLLDCIRNLQEAARHIEDGLVGMTASSAHGTIFSPCVAAAHAALTSRPCEPVNYTELAKSCGTSYSTLRTAFRTEVGITLGQYHLGLCLGEARRLLAQTDLSVSDVAEMTGFCDQKHFTSIFKRKTGVTPSVYRKTGGEQF